MYSYGRLTGTIADAQPMPIPLMNLATNNMALNTVTVDV